MADIVMTFRGAEYRIPDAQIFEVGSQVEDIARFYEISGWLTNPHLHKLSRCVGVMLRAAGAKVTDREVHAELAVSAANGGGSYMISILFSLITALMDGAPESGGEPGEPTPAS